MSSPLVVIFMGSKSDLSHCEKIEKAVKVLFGEALRDALEPGHQLRDANRLGSQNSGSPVGTPGGLRENGC